MIRLVIDPYDSYSPYSLDDWKRVRKTRWSGDDGFKNPVIKERAKNQLVSLNNKRKKSKNATSLVSTESSLDSSTEGKKRNRWGTQARTKLTVDDMKQFQARIEVINRISKKLLEPNCRPLPGDTFLDLPEPEPQYDSAGKRTNTLEMRYKEKLENDRNFLTYHLMQLNPTYKASATYKPPNFEYVLWFPIKEYPDTNFVGAVLGPRGNTQKRLEKETGCKIAVRGKGAEKNVVRMIKNPRTGVLEDMPHHVFIIAQSEEKLEKGIEAVKPLLKPQTEIARLEQMKELALINGTYRFDMFCKECGEAGHKDFQCPQKKNTYFANVQCEKCGDVSHVTNDCPQKGIFESTKKELDIEYKQFLAEINGEDPAEAKKLAEFENKLIEEREKNQEKFMSKKLNASVTVLKPTTLTSVVVHGSETQK